MPSGCVESLVEKFFRPDDVPVPRPGSVVVVTEKDLTDRSDNVARLAVFAQIIGGLVTLAAILRR